MGKNRNIEENYVFSELHIHINHNKKILERLYSTGRLFNCIGHYMLVIAKYIALFLAYMFGTPSSFLLYLYGPYKHI